MSAHIITPFGDITPLPTVLLWGGLGNGQLANDPGQLSVGGIIYSYSSAISAKADYMTIKAALLSWDGVSPINVQHQVPSSPMTISSVGGVSSGAVMVTGTNFTSGIQAYVGSQFAMVQIQNSTTAVVNLPSNPAGSKQDLTLYRAPGDLVTSPGAITYPSGGGGGGGLSFASVSPSTGTNGTIFGGTISGSGFTGSGINAFALGIGGVPYSTYVVAGNFVLTSNTLITFNGTGAFLYSGSYIWLYSTDGGATWISTGLPFNVS